MFGIKPKEKTEAAPELKQDASNAAPSVGQQVVPPLKPKKPGLLSLLFAKKKNEGAAFVKPPIDPETGGIKHPSVETKFKRMGYMEKYSYRGTRVIFIIIGILFFAIAFYLGFLAVRAVLPKPDSDHDTFPDSLDACAGFDDRVDVDHDGTPDGCDKAVTPGDFSDVTINTPTLVTSDDKIYDVVFVVTDANKTWGVTNLKYKVEVLSAAGAVLKSQVSTTYVNAGTSTTIVEANLSTAEKAASAKVTMMSGDFAAAVSTQNIALAIKNKTFTPRTSDGTALFSGVLENASNFALNVVNVTMIVKDSSGAIVADNLSKINTVHPNENRYFELRFPQSLDPGVTYEITATTNGMDQSNLIPKQGGGSQF
jgi:hypothetical protein